VPGVRARTGCSPTFMGKSTTKVIRCQIILYRKYSNDWALGLSGCLLLSRFRPYSIWFPPIKQPLALEGMDPGWMTGKPEVIDCSVGLVPTKRFSSDRPSAGEKPTSPE